MRGSVSWRGSAGISGLITLAAFATKFLGDLSYTDITTMPFPELLYDSARFLIGTFVSSLLALKGFASIQK